MLTFRMFLLLLVSAWLGGRSVFRAKRCLSSSASLLMRSLCSYLTYIKLSTAIKRNESMAKSLQKALLQQQRSEEDGKRTPRPQDLIRLYDIILQVYVRWAPSRLSSNAVFQSFFCLFYTAPNSCHSFCWLEKVAAKKGLCLFFISSFSISHIHFQLTVGACGSGSYEWERSCLRKELLHVKS